MNSTAPVLASIPSRVFIWFALSVYYEKNANPLDSMILFEGECAMSSLPVHVRVSRPLFSYGRLSCCVHTRAGRPSLGAILSLGAMCQPAREPLGTRREMVYGYHGENKGVSEGSSGIFLMPC